MSSYTACICSANLSAAAASGRLQHRARSPAADRRLLGEGRERERERNVCVGGREHLGHQYIYTADRLTLSQLLLYTKGTSEILFSSSRARFRSADALSKTSASCLPATRSALSLS